MLRSWFFAVLLLIANWTSAAEPVFKRWAVIASPELQKDGVSDLLFAELSAKSIELVEREELSAVTKEIELAKLLGADATASRLKIGQLTKADALVLLMEVENEKQGRSAKLVICDCRYGARLRMEHWPLLKQAPDRLAADVAQVVLQTRAKFERGVERVVAITPLISKNLTHEFDLWQFGFSELLGQALSEQQGVAVMEIAEAQAIRAELMRTSTDLSRVPVPLVVDGEFEVERPIAPAKDSVMRVRLRPNDGSAQRDVVSFDGTPTATVEWVRRMAPSALLARSTDDARASLSVDQQFELLVARADRFAYLLDWSAAVKIRAAALLVKPHDRQHELKWMREQQLTLAGRFRASQAAALQQYPIGIGGRDALRNKELRAAESAYLDGLLGLVLRTRSLVSYRELHPNDAAWLLRECFNEFSSQSSLAEAHGDLKSELEKLFFEWCEHHPHLPTNAPWLTAAPGFGANSGGVILWKETARQCLQLLSRRHDSARTQPGPRVCFDEKRGLELFARFLTKYVPERAGLLDWMKDFTLREKQYFRQNMDENHWKPEQLLAFYQQLEDSGQKANQIYARCGRLSLAWVQHPANEPTEKLLAEANALRTEISTMEGRQAFLIYIDRVRQELSAASKKTSPAAPMTTTRTKSPAKPPPSTGRLAFEPLTTKPPQWTRLFQAPNNIDIAWSSLEVEAIFARDRKSSLYRSASADNPVQWVCHDGRYLWIATGLEGIRIYSLPDNESPMEWKLVAQVGAAQGLPDYHSAQVDQFPRGLHLQAVGPGRCIAVASTRSLKKLWFADITVEESLLQTDRASAARVKVFHTASERRAFNDGQLASQDPSIDEVFSVTWTLLISTGSGEQRESWLLFGRFPRSALRVNLKTLAVDTMPTVARDSYSDRTGQDIVLLGTGFIKAINGGVVLWSLAKDSSEWQRRDLVQYPANVRPMVLLEHDGWAYYPGELWYRINLKTLEHERLNEQRLPNSRLFGQYAVSQHYGIVGWRHARFDETPLPLTQVRLQEK